MERILSIELFGQEYKFKTEINEIEAKKAIDLLLEQVNKTEKQQSAKTNHINKLSIIIIVALNMANKNIELQKKNSGLLSNISKGYETLIAKLNSVLK
ncbi:MAG: cell division protein ZapA [Deltaproteobacteria bacterium]|nr:cell division protein ZapA [Deltaproteobacteria bacterium]